MGREDDGRVDEIKSLVEHGHWGWRWPIASTYKVPGKIDEAVYWHGQTIQLLRSTG